MIGSLSGWPPPKPPAHSTSHFTDEEKKAQRGPGCQGHTARQWLQSQTYPSSIRGSHAGQLWLPRGHLAVSRDILECHKVLLCEVLLLKLGGRAMLLNIPGQPHHKELSGPQMPTVPRVRNPGLRVTDTHISLDS